MAGHPTLKKALPMIHAQDTKFINVTPPAAIVDNASYTTAEIDTLGYDYATIVVYIGATDIAMTALKVTQSDTAGSGHADISGLTWGSDTNIDGSTSALPSADDDNTFQVAQINLVGRKRYLDVTATAGNGSAGTFAAIFCILSRGDEVANTAASQGADEVLAV